MIKMGAVGTVGKIHSNENGLEVALTLGYELYCDFENCWNDVKLVAILSSALKLLASLKLQRERPPPVGLEADPSIGLKAFPSSNLS